MAVFDLCLRFSLLRRRLMLATRPVLPIDVVRLILEAVYLIPDHTLWDEDSLGRRVAWFASTLHVSRTWHVAGQSSLYHRIQLNTPYERSIALLVRTFSEKSHIAQMVKALHVHSLAGREGKIYRKAGLPLPMPRISSFTQKGRRAWRENQEHEMLARLLGLCEAMAELRLEPSDLSFVVHVLDSIQKRVDRLTIGRAHEVSRDQWEGLAQSTLWRNLRSIKFIANNPNSVRFERDGIYGLDVAFTGPEPFTRLEKLEIMGYTHAETLHTIIDAVRPTLKTLYCDQTKEKSSIWLSLVSTRLQNLGLAVWPSTLLADLSSFTQLETLTVTLTRAIYSSARKSMIILPRNLPPPISVFELKVTAQFNPWSAASHVARVLPLTLDFYPIYTSSSSLLT